LSADNLINDPSFELGLPETSGNWQRSARADRETIVDAYDGAWIQDSEYDRTPGTAIGRFGQHVTIEPAHVGLLHHVSFWARCTTLSAPTDPTRDATGMIEFRMGLFDGHFNLASLHNVPDGQQIEEVRLSYLTMTGGRVDVPRFLAVNTLLDPAGDWLPFSFDVVPGQQLVSLWGLPDYVGPQDFDDARWEAMLQFDSFVMELADSLRRRIREALVERLKVITTGGGYSVDIGEVTADKTSRRAISSFPAVIVGFGDEEKGQSAMHKKHGMLRFPLLLTCEGPTAHQQCDDVAADIEKALESVVVGTFIGLDFVDDVRVVLINRIEEKEAAALGLMQTLIDVLVVYRHPRAQP